METRRLDGFGEYTLMVTNAHDNTGKGCVTDSDLRVLIGRHDRALKFLALGHKRLVALSELALIAARAWPAYFVGDPPWP